MTCKNCKNEFEKGKFCPECGFPVETKKDKNERAMELLESMNERLTILEENDTKRLERLKEMRKEKKNGETGSGKSRGIFDIL